MHVKVLNEYHLPYHLHTITKLVQQARASSSVFIPYPPYQPNESKKDAKCDRLNATRDAPLELPHRHDTIYRYDTWHPLTMTMLCHVLKDQHANVGFHETTSHRDTMPRRCDIVSCLCLKGL